MINDLIWLPSSTQFLISHEYKLYAVDVLTRTFLTEIKPGYDISSLCFNRNGSKMIYLVQNHYVIYDLLGEN